MKRLLSGLIISLILALGVSTSFAQSNTRICVQSGNSCIPVDSTAPLPVGVTGTFSITATNLSTNIAQINGITPLMGNGVTGTGSPRVTIASDNTPFPTKIDQTTSGTTNGVVNTASSATTAGTTSVVSSSLEANHIIKASAGNLYGFQISADTTLSAVPWWVMVYNATSAPGDGAVTPIKCYAVPSGTTSIAASWYMPVVFSTGITIGVSTTGCFTKTASAHAFISGDAQ